LSAYYCNKTAVHASYKIDKAMDSTGAGDAFGLILFAYIKDKIHQGMFRYFVPALNQ
jgi:sugar/nucleoside kinase (ribokinase family)